MHEQPPPREAAEALAEIRQRHEQVLDRSLTPNWFWWAVGLLVVGFSTAVETENGLVIGIGTTVFVLGLCAAVGVVVVRSLRHAQPRSELLGSAGARQIAVFVLGVLAVTLPASLVLGALDTPYAATWGSLVCAVLLGVGGPILMRRVRATMLDRATKGSR
ncbi:hypothetical protein ACFFQW_28655 [Umezawaea endophytica]|uniref:Uncharacterized protein n=1 Tax=Umezawaea endophytica TaxID=1654476 RepID=A0A9X2VXQ3_9PSEU|nr:hypothetical protein [Umezawaea endophytica]MCS7483939.1 hypothetical protein [Umezawaea endophytica]